MKLLRILPNAITCSRILASPIIVLCAFWGNWGLVFWIVVAAFFTDIIDGEIARRLNAVTKLGGNLDQTADATCALAIVVAALAIPNPPTWLFLGTAMFIGTCICWLPIVKVSSVKIVANWMRMPCWIILVSADICQFGRLSQISIQAILLSEIATLLILAIWKHKRVEQWIGDRVNPPTE
ncbi:MAG: CDP-alcohol phosphatidyltransferase family protein [Candidatus Berkelbacteria bacterium]